MNLQSEIHKISFNHFYNNYKLILKNIESSDFCEIDIMSHDAKNIALARECIATPRLKTYNLITNLFDLLKIKVDKVIISKKNNFITSKIILIIDNNKVSVESNFIDSIIISLKTFSVLLIDTNLFKSTKNLIYEKLEYIDLKDKSLLLLDDENKIKRLKKTLAKLIQDEKYESAALVRDKIDKISKS